MTITYNDTIKQYLEAIEEAMQNLAKTIAKTQHPAFQSIGYTTQEAISGSESEFIFVMDSDAQKHLADLYGASLRLSDDVCFRGDLTMAGAVDIEAPWLASTNLNATNCGTLEGRAVLNPEILGEFKSASPKSPPTLAFGDALIRPGDWVKIKYQNLTSDWLEVMLTNAGQHSRRGGPRLAVQWYAKNDPTGLDKVEILEHEPAHDYSQVVLLAGRGSFGKEKPLWGSDGFMLWHQDAEGSRWYEIDASPDDFDQPADQPFRKGDQVIAIRDTVTQTGGFVPKGSVGCVTGAPNGLRTPWLAGDSTGQHAYVNVEWDVTNLRTTKVADLHHLARESVGYAR